MATQKYRTLYEDIITQASSYLDTDTTYTTKSFKRLEYIELEDLENAERFANQPYQYDLIITDITAIDEDDFFADNPEQDEICGGLNLADGQFNGSGYYDVTFNLRITQPNNGFNNDESLRFSRPAIGKDILIDIFNSITGYKLKDHDIQDAIYLNDNEIVLSQSTFSVATKL